MFNKHLNFILLLMNICLCLSEVTITPSKEIVIKEGEPLKIICSASEKVDFFFPKNNSGLAATSPTLFFSESADGATKFTLERSKSVFGDTGWYGCVESSRNQRKLNERELSVTPDTYDEIEIKWVYAFVESEEHPFTIDSKNYEVQGSTGRNLILPCRPTSPEYNVTLSLSPEVNQSRYFQSIDYDPKIGFTIHDVELNFNGHHICQIENLPNKNITINAKIHEKGEVDPKIYVDDHRSLQQLYLQQMKIGGNFSLFCSIHRPKGYGTDSLSWVVPKKSHPIITTEEFYHYHSSDYQSERLDIINITENDAGEYKCQFYSRHGIRTSKISLQLHTIEHLEVSSKGLYGIRKKLYAEKYNKLEIYVQISAFPLPTIKWFDPKGREDFYKWVEPKEINTDNFTVLLEKYSPTLEDEGTYKLIVNNSAGRKEIDFFVEMIAKPSIKRIPIKIFEVSKFEILTAECKAEGKLLENIFWDYERVFFNLSENSLKNNSVKIDSTIEGNKIKSTIEFKAETTGKIICHACNEVGCDSAVVKVISIPVTVEVVPEATNTSYKEVFINQGDPLTINCKSTNNVMFFYPKSNKKKRASDSIIISNSCDHSAKFERREIVIADGGWYGCGNIPENYEIESQNQTPDTYHQSNVKWIWVIILSRFGLFAELPYPPKGDDGHYHLSAKVGSDLVLPCRSYSTDTDIELRSGEKKINAEYDQKKGFIIRNIQQNSPTFYTCWAAKYGIRDGRKFHGETKTKYFEIKLID